MRCNEQYILQKLLVCAFFIFISLTQGLSQEKESVEEQLQAIKSAWSKKLSDNGLYKDDLERILEAEMSIQKKYIGLDEVSSVEKRKEIRLNEAEKLLIEFNVIGRGQDSAFIRRAACEKWADWFHKDFLTSRMILKKIRDVEMIKSFAAEQRSNLKKYELVKIKKLIDSFEKYFILEIDKYHEIQKKNEWILVGSYQSEIDKLAKKVNFEEARQLSKARLDFLLETNNKKIESKRALYVKKSSKAEKNIRKKLESKLNTINKEIAREVQALSRNSLAKAESLQELGNLLNKDVRRVFEGVANSSWKLVFSSKTPIIWNTRHDDDEGFSMPVSEFPNTTKYLMIKNKSNLEYVIIKIEKKDLLKREHVLKEHVWGSNSDSSSYQKFQLGIAKKSWSSDDSGVNVGSFKSGYGFGYMSSKDFSLGYCWAGKRVAPTVFEFSVKTSELSSGELTKLLE